LFIHISPNYLKDCEFTGFGVGDTITPLAFGPKLTIPTRFALRKWPFRFKICCFMYQNPKKRRTTAPLSIIKIKFQKEA
jgi:hypothetical protein